MEFEELTWPERGRLWLRLLIRLVCTVVFLLLVFKVGKPVAIFCMPFVVAVIFTWLLEPVIRFLTKRTFFSRKASSILLILLLCSALGGLATWFFYQIGIQIASLAQNWNTIWVQIQSVYTQLADELSRYTDYLPDAIQNWLPGFFEQFMEWIKGIGMTFVLPKTTSFAAAIPSVFLATVFCLMATYFISSDYPRIGAVVTHWMPVNLRAFLRFLQAAFHTAFGGYVKAEFLLSVVVFFILVVGFYCMGLTYGLLLAFFFAVLDFIPIIGAGTIMVPWAIIEVCLGNWKTAVYLMIIWGIIVVFRRLAEPRFVGNQTGLHPVLSLLSIYVGMKAFGVLGMVLAPVFLLVIINVCASGVFDHLVADVTLAFQDTTAFLQRSGRTPSAESPSLDQLPADHDSNSIP